MPGESFRRSSKKMSHSVQMMIAKLMVVMVACMLPKPVDSSDSCDWWCQGYNAPWGYVVSSSRLLSSALPVPHRVRVLPQSQVRLEFWSLRGLRRVRAASHREMRRLVQRACEPM